MTQPTARKPHSKSRHCGRCRRWTTERGHRLCPDCWDFLCKEAVTLYAAAPAQEFDTVLQQLLQIRETKVFRDAEYVWHALCALEERRGTTVAPSTGGGDGR